MFDVDFTELLVIFVVALIVLGPARLPGLVSKVGRWAGKARSMARQFREQLESEVQLEELNNIGKTKPASTTYPPPPPEFGGEPAQPQDTAAGEAPPADAAQAPADPEPGSSIPADDPSHRDLSDDAPAQPQEPPHERNA